MTPGAVAELCEMFKENIVVPALLNYEGLNREFGYNIAENILIAIRTQETPMKKSTQKTKSTKPLNRNGQLAFVSEMIVAGTYTFNQIVTAALEKYPEWPVHLAKQGLHNAKMRLRKKGSNANWLPEPAATAV